MNLNAGSRGRAVALALCFAALAGCAETKLGVHFLKSATRTVESASGPVSTPVKPTQPALAQADARLAPERFSAAGTAVWDGAGTLEGVWIAHPLAERPERVRVLNTATGATVESAMFRRDPAMPGPSIIVSSDAARALGLIPGAPTELEVTALVDDEPSAHGTEVATATNAAEARALPGPAPVSTVMAGPGPAIVTVDAGAAPTPPRPRPASRTSIDSAGDMGAIVHAADTTPRARPAKAREAPPQPQPIAGPPAGRYLQVGSFGVEANAAALVERLRAGDQPSRLVERDAGGRRMSIVLIGPLASDEAVASAREAAAAEGINDAIEVIQ